MYRLLLIDDEAPKVRANVFNSFNEDQGYHFDLQTRVSGTPWELVDNADIILIDYSFPDQHTGMEFLRDLRNARPSIRMPVVLLSAPSDIRDAEWQKCLELGVNDFICKATPPQIVKRKVDSLLEGEAYRRLSEQLKEKLQMEEGTSPSESLDYGAISALVPDADEWAYTFRIIVNEGPLHRRKTNAVFLAIQNELLSRLAEKMEKEIEPYPHATIDSAPQEASSFSRQPQGSVGGNMSPLPKGGRLMEAAKSVPLGIPGRLLTKIFDNDRERIAEVVKNLLTGPPHEVFTNVLMLHVYEAFHQILGEKTPQTKEIREQRKSL